MVSGDIFSDRETLGILFLILAIEAPGAVMASSRVRPVREPASPPTNLAPEAATIAGSPRSGPTPSGVVVQGRGPTRRPQAWI
jgi:hypothetical protein